MMSFLVDTMFHGSGGKIRRHILKMTGKMSKEFTMTCVLDSLP